jgi:hypothetical protein
MGGRAGLGEGVVVRAPLTSGRPLTPATSRTHSRHPHAQLTWDGTNFFGASLSAFAALGRQAGYTLVYADSLGVNLFFVADELQPAQRFARAGDEAALWRPPGYADCQMYQRPAGHCEDAVIGTNRSYLRAADLLAAPHAYAAGPV